MFGNWCEENFYFPKILLRSFRYNLTTFYEIEFRPYPNPHPISSMTPILIQYTSLNLIPTTDQILNLDLTRLWHNSNLGLSNQPNHELTRTQFWLEAQPHIWSWIEIEDPPPSQDVSLISSWDWGWVKMIRIGFGIGILSLGWGPKSRRGQGCVLSWSGVGSLELAVGSLVRGRESGPKSEWWNWKIQNIFLTLRKKVIFLKLEET